MDVWLYRGGLRESPAVKMHRCPAGKSLQGPTALTDMQCRRACRAFPPIHGFAAAFRGSFFAN